MLTRSNNSSVEDLASGQASGGDNGSGESSSRGTIAEAPQRPVRGDVSFVGKGVRLLSGQEALKNSGTISTGDPTKVDALLDNEKSDREDVIAAEIEWLKKE